MAGNDPNESHVESARTALDTSRVQLNARLFQARESALALELIERQHGLDAGQTAAAIIARQAADEAVKEARAVAATAGVHLNEIIKGMLDGGIDRDVARLSADYPVVLLPVRIETRFKQSAVGPQLWVRIYPDEIVADLHEPELTETERDAGFTYAGVGRS